MNDTEQTPLHDENGNFAKGNKPPAGFNKHPQNRNNGGVPKRFLEIRKEIANLLDPNLTLEDYKRIYNEASSKSLIRAVFAEAVIKKDIKTIFEMINQAHGKAAQSIDVTSNGETVKGATIVFDEQPDNDPTSNQDTEVS